MPKTHTLALRRIKGKKIIHIGICFHEKFCENYFFLIFKVPSIENKLFRVETEGDQTRSLHIFKKKKQRLNIVTNAEYTSNALIDMVTQGVLITHIIIRG